MIRKLKERRARIKKRIARTQRRRERFNKFARWARKRGFEGLSKRVEKIVDRLTRDIKDDHRELKQIHQEIDRLQEQRDNDRKNFVKWCHSKLGVDENDAEAHAWVRELFGSGSAASVPWCSIFVGIGLKKFGVSLPSSVAYSGSWLNWAHGDEVSYSQAQPGDLLIFDWGDGGMTDHVAVYVGEGYMIGGNQRDSDTGGQVSKTSVPASAIVGVVRPDWNN